VSDEKLLENKYATFSK